MSKIQPFSPAPPPSTYSTSAGSIKHHGGKPYTGADASRSIEEPGGRSSKSDEAMRFLSDRIADLESRAREEKLVQRVGELETKYLDVRALEGVLGKLLQRMDALEQARAADAAQVEADRLAHQNLQGEVAKIEDDLNKRCLGEDGLEGVVEKLGGRVDELEQARAADAAQVETDGEAASLAHQNLQDEVAKMQAALDAQSGELQSMPEAQQREIAPGQQQTSLEAIAQAIGVMYDHLQANQRSYAHLATWAVQRDREQLGCVSEAVTRGVLIMTEALERNAFNARFHESELSVRSKELEARLVEQLARLDTRLGAALQAAEAKNVKLEAALEAQHREIEQLKSVCSSLAAPDHSAEAVEFVLLGEGEKE